MLNFVEIEPGYVVNGINGLGLVEIEPGYGVNGADDVMLVGAGMGAAYPDYGQMYDGVQLVGVDDETPFYKRPLVIGGIALGVLAAAAGGYMLMRR